MLEPNTLLQNRYLIVRKLGQGGMGAVYQATDQRFGSTVAIKETLVTAEYLRKAFEHEARLLNSLRHTALPVVSDYFSEGDGVFLVMQFIPGEDLSTLLKQNAGPFSVAQVLRWGDLLLDALDYLHGHNPPVIHRDIKPENLKLTPRGDVILLDFGLAKGAAEGMVPATMASVIGYTPHYAPFEQIQGVGTNPRSDLFALGATMYHLMTNMIPFDALTRSGALLGGKPDPLPPANKVNPLVPPAVAAVLAQAMAISPDQRPDNASEMRRALRDAGQSAPPVNADKKADAESPTVIDETRKGGSDSDHESVKRPTEVNPRFPAMTRPMLKEERPTELNATSNQISPPQTVAPSAQSRSGAMWKWLVPAGVVVVALVVAASLGLFSSKSKIPSTSASGNAAPVSSALPLKSFTFEAATLDGSGAVISRKAGEAQYYSEDLGTGVMLEMVSVPGGIFLMGSPSQEKGRFGEEGPEHNAQLPAFYMGKYEVTQAQWRAVAGLAKINRDLVASPSQFEGVNRPVERVSWEDAQEFCARLSKKTGKTYRLPSETEWEYACRGGTTAPFAFGENITSDLVNFDARTPYESGPKGTYRAQTMTVGSGGAPNAFGLYDMHGNVMEWCADSWHPSYNGAPSDGSVWESGGDASKKMLRGGSWNRNGNNCRSAYRLKESATSKFDVIGFRVVMDAGAK